MTDLPADVPNFSKGNGLIVAIAQDATTGDVLMVGYMNREAFDETISTGRATYYSRSRQKLWQKGESSGHWQQVQSVLIDCDADAVLLKVDQVGDAACHMGYRSCFFREVSHRDLRTIADRVFDPAEIYRES